MREIESFPYEVTETEHVWIPMSDGVRLSARIWMPESASREPVPAILEYIPYRKRDATRVRDEVMHRYFAGHGYAAVRVDLRGSGDSEGILTDEYLPRELDDGAEVLRWIAEQDWCDGKRGMIGISWGGFNALQIAATHPDSVDAVISVCSTDDRYADDVHYMGGCLLGDNLSWASTMFSYNSLPPDPAIVGDAWRDMWESRLRNNRPWLETWLRHQHRDDYWRHGSICEDWEAIRCPVMAVSGWADGYSNAVFRMLEHLEGPRMALVGPWSHKYPHLGVPGPAIGFLQEALRWWDKWLKGVESGIMDEPLLRAWMQESVPPTTSYPFRPGRWVAEPEWPSSNISERVYHLSWPGRLEQGEVGGPQSEMTVQSPLSVGLFAGKWCSYSATPDLPHDQREEDGGAMVFESGPLEDDLEILGRPRVDLELSVDQPVAMVAVRLSDVAPDDQATRITYGLLNLTHRDGHSEPRPLTPGRRERVRVRLNDVAQSLPAGNRLRVSISTSYWPLAWPAPKPVRLTVHPSASSLTLPERRPRAEDELVAFGEPEGAVRPDVERLAAGEHNWRVIRDLATDVSTLEVVNDDGEVWMEDPDLLFARSGTEWYSSRGNDFDSLRGETVWERRLARGEWSARTLTRTVLRSTETDFVLEAELDAWEGDLRVYSNNWSCSIPRHLV